MQRQLPNVVLQLVADVLKRARLLGIACKKGRDFGAHGNTRRHDEVVGFFIGAFGSWKFQSGGKLVFNYGREDEFSYVNPNFDVFERFRLQLILDF